MASGREIFPGRLTFELADGEPPAPGGQSLAYVELAHAGTPDRSARTGGRGRSHRLYAWIVRTLSCAYLVERRLLDAAERRP